MAIVVGGIQVDPQGQTLAVNITMPNTGQSVVAYPATTDRTPWPRNSSGSPVSFPATISSPTTFYVTAVGDYTVSATLNGEELAGGFGQTTTVNVNGERVTVTPQIRSFPEEERYQSGTFAPAQRQLTIPAVYPVRTGDLTLTANTAYGSRYTILDKTRVRRGRVRVSGATGTMSVGAYSTAKAQLVTSGLANVGPAGSWGQEIALPPTDIPAGDVEVWMSVSGASGFAASGSQGDVNGSQQAPTSHPLPANLTGVIASSTGVVVTLLADDPTPLSVAYSRTTMPVSVIGQIGSRLYGRNTSNDNWSISDDSGTTWTDQAYTFTQTFGAGNSGLQLIGHGASYMVAIDDHGHIKIAAKDVFTSWTDISAPAPVGTTGRVGEICSDGTNLLYGNYNAANPEGSWPGAFIYRSTNATTSGATWTQITLAASSRHVHAIEQDPGTLTTFWATVGDDVANGAGLYKSTDSGATWTQVASNMYAIDFTFAYSLTGAPNQILLEGDGTLKPQTMRFYPTLASSQLDPLVWGDTNPTDGLGTWGGTARAVLYTAEGNLIWASSDEGGTAPNNYLRNGLWIARGPHFTTPVLLEEFTDATVPSWRKTYTSGTYFINGVNRMTRPKFAGQ